MTTYIYRYKDIITVTIEAEYEHEAYRKLMLRLVQANELNIWLPSAYDFEMVSCF